MEVTKEFWKKTWESADAKTAAENDPLFDPVSTAEMALHYLEALHPGCEFCCCLLRLGVFRRRSAGNSVYSGLIANTSKENRDRHQFTLP